MNENTWVLADDDCLTIISPRLSVELYLSPVETYCENINYYIPDEENLTKSFSEERMARLREY